MRTLILFFLVSLGLSANAQVWVSDRSSRTISADTLQRIPRSGPGDVLTRVLVTSCSATAGDVFRIFDSSGVASSTIAANIQMSTFTLGGLAQDCVKEYLFLLRVSSAITYTKQGAGEVVILWNDNSKEIP